MFPNLRVPNQCWSVCQSPPKSCQHRDAKGIGEYKKHLKLGNILSRTPNTNGLLRQLDIASQSIGGQQGHFLLGKQPIRSWALQSGMLKPIASGSAVKQEKGIDYRHNGSGNGLQSV